MWIQTWEVPLAFGKSKKSDPRKIKWKTVPLKFPEINVMNVWFAFTGC